MEDKNSLQYNIGRILGFTNNSPEISAYSKKIDGSSDHLNRKTKESFRLITQHITEVENRLGKFYSSLHQKQKKLTLQQGRQLRIVKRVNRVYRRKGKTLPDTEKWLQGIVAVGAGKLGKVAEMVDEQNQEVLTMIKGMEAYMKATLEEIQAEFEAYLEETKQEKAAHETLQIGSLAGLALKVIKK